MASIPGLGSGLDTNSIISQLMQIEQIPQQRLASQRLQALGRQTAWTQLGGVIAALKTATDKISSTSLNMVPAATSSNTAVLGVTAGAGAAAGTYTLRINALAKAQQLTSADTFASATSVVGAGALLLQRGLGASLGLTSVTSPAGPGAAATGDYTVAVTQASSAASLTGTAVAASTTISSLNNQLVLTRTDPTGTAITKTMTLTAGTYTPATLATEVQRAIDDPVNGFGAGNLSVTTTPTGALSFATTAEGASASITVGSSLTTANSALGLASGQTAAGLSALVSVNGGAAVAVDPSKGPASLSGLTFAVGSHVAAGSAEVTVARTTSTTATVSDLAAALNRANGIATGTVVPVGNGTFRLALTGSKTGAGFDAAATVDGLTGFGTGFTSAAGTDAAVTFNGLALTRSTNNITDMIPGVTLNLVKADTVNDVTVSINPDVAGLAAKAADVVKNINTVLSTISTSTRYDLAGKQRAPLTGDSSARSLQSSLYSAIESVDPTGTTTAPSLATIGIMAQRDGTYAVDDTKLRAALTSDPTGTSTLLANLGTALSTYATNSGSTTNGVARTASDGAGADALRLQRAVNDWDLRLSTIRDRYTRQFSALDSALGKLKNQGSWLSGQLAGLR